MPDPNVTTGLSGSFLANLLVTALALAFVLALAWALLRLLKRGMHMRGMAAGAAAPQVLQAISLGGRERLVLVRHAGADYLLGVTPASVTVVDKQPAPTATASSAAQAESAAAVL